MVDPEVRKNPAQSRQRLADLIDVPSLQALMDGFTRLTSIPMALLDSEGTIIVGAGWQSVCTDYHRVHPVSCNHCVESDTALTANIPVGKATLYRCKNGMWDAAMPVTVAGERVGNVFAGQFFFDDEEIDLEFYAAQADRFGFDREKYLAAVQSVPRLSREKVDQGLRFLTSLANMISQLTLVNSDLTSMVRRNEQLLERERNQADRLRTIAEIESVLTSSLDFSEVVRLALASADTHLGVIASSLWTMDKSRQRLCVVGSRGFPDEFLADFPEGIPLEGHFPVARAARGRQLVIFESVASSEIHRPVAEAYARHGISLGALVAAPLVARDTVIGGMTLAWETEREFDADDLTLIDTLARRFGVAVENARLFQAEHMIAETLQETLVVIPKQLDGLSYSRAYETATFESGRVGGDFVDVFNVHGTIVGITLGDVSGKGLDAAVTTSLVRTTLRVHALDGLPPAVVGEKANRIMRRFSEVEAFVTLWFGLLDTATGHLRYICAGHPPGFVLRASGEIRELECLDPILGAFDETQFYESQTVLDRGDRLVLYSDGVTEARSPDGDFLRDDGLRAILKRLRDVPTTELSAAIMTEVVEYSKGVLRDDAAILSIEAVAEAGRKSQAPSA